MSKIGVDISTYQKGVNYDEAVDHIDFAIIRVGYGVSYLPDSQRDTEFDNHYWGFKGKVPLGAYYYAYGTSYDTGRKEAENCLAYMEDKQFEMPIYYDMEENRNTKEAGQGFVDRIREAGLKAGIYASSSFFKNKGLAEIDCDSRWIAAYGSNNGEIQENANPNNNGINCDLWQYSSKGYVEGIGSNIDMDLMFDGEYTPEPSPEPTPEPSGYGTIRDIQRWCNNNYGTGIAEDGIYGPQTKKALIKAL
jgi:GH25 family lysozyme M1 (1,4-beta-N-acetylmuramidase)